MISSRAAGGSSSSPAVAGRPAASARARILVGALVAVLVHAPVLAALRPAGAQERSAGESAASRRAAARVERAALLRTAEPDVASGRVTLGETLIRLGWLDGVEESVEESANEPADRVDLERALVAYRAMLTEVRAAVAGGAPVESAIVDAVAHDGRAGRYKRMYPRLADALVHGGGNCVAQSTLATTLAHDAGRGDSASMRVYANHVAPDVAGFRFGMAKRCHGPGEPLAAKDLLTAYARARATGDREPFAFPHADDRCDDPGDVFGGLQLVASDAPPMARPLGPPGGPAPAAAREPECRRRTVLEEYDEDVEVLGADGRTLGGVGIPRATSLDLEGHATSAACFERRIAALAGADAPRASDASDAAIDPELLVLALGDAAMASEEAARVFAEAGELDVAREYERRLAGHRTRAAAPLERVIARLGDQDADVRDLLAGAGRLVALGEGGRTAMLLASERHRGFWELANLMTRPSSQVGALQRWSKKPVEVRLDVIDALPCASETFLAQLDGMNLAAARALRDACEVRARVDQETCALDDALAHARRGMRSPDRDANDLAEAVLVRHLSARCRTSDFGIAGRRWAASKPEPIARALASRLAAP